MSTGWFKATRSADAMELIRANRNAFLLAYIIASRARYADGFNRHNLEMGEAMIGDYEAFGLTRREYRTAVENLREWGFSTFKTTTKGTIARLTDSRLFVACDETDGQQDGQRPANARPTPGQRTATNKKERRKEGEEDVGQISLPGVEPSDPQQAPRPAVAGPASDADWLQGLKEDPAYAGIDVGREHGKLLRWCQENRRQPTRRRFVNWLNRCDRPMTANPRQQVSHNTGTLNDGPTNPYAGIGKV